MTHPVTYTLYCHCKATGLLRLSKLRQELHTQIPQTTESCTIPSLQTALEGQSCTSHSCSSICCLNVCLQMFHDVSLLNMDHLHGANTPAFPFSQRTGGLGGTYFYHSPLHYIPWIDTRGGNSEKRVLLQVSTPICCECSFQICKVAFKFGVDVSDPIPHLNTKDVAKKIKMSTWKCHPNAGCPTR